MAIIKATDGFISTFGNPEHKILIDSKKHNRIIDANTGKIVDNNIASVTVLCDDAVICEVLAKVCSMLKMNRVIELLNKYNAKGIIIDDDSNIFISQALKNSIILTNKSFIIKDLL